MAEVSHNSQRFNRVIITAIKYLLCLSTFGLVLHTMIVLYTKEVECDSYGQDQDFPWQKYRMPFKGLQTVDPMVPKEDEAFEATRIENDELNQKVLKTRKLKHTKGYVGESQTPPYSLSVLEENEENNLSPSKKANAYRSNDIQRTPEDSNDVKDSLELQDTDNDIAVITEKTNKIISQRERRKQFKVNPEIETKNRAKDAEVALDADSQNEPRITEFLEQSTIGARRKTYVRPRSTHKNNSDVTSVNVPNKLQKDIKPKPTTLAPGGGDSNTLEADRVIPNNVSEINFSSQNSANEDNNAKSTEDIERKKNKFPKSRKSPSKHAIVNKYTNSRVPKRVPIEELESFHQDDPWLVKYMRTYHIYPPSKREYNFRKTQKKTKSDNGNLTDPSKNKGLLTESSIVSTIQEVLNNKTNGFFVDVGSADENTSVSYLLEKNYNWTGLLIQGSPVVFPRLISVHRKAWISDVLVSPSSRPLITSFHLDDNKGGDTALKSLNYSSNGRDVIKLLGVPLYTLISALEITKVDLLKLNLPHSHATDILLRFLFDQISIEVISVEVSNADLDAAKLKALRTMLKSKKYYPITETKTVIVFAKQNSKRILSDATMSAQEQKVKNKQMQITEEDEK